MDTNERARGGRTWTAALAAAALTVTMLPGGVAHAQSERAAAPAQSATAPPTVVVEVNKPVSLEVRNSPRVITDWEEGEPIPAGYHPVQRLRKGAIVGGAVPFAILYFFSALVAAVAQDNGGDRSTMGLFVPVAGPFITMTQTSSSVANLFLVLDGLGQGAGAALVVYGLSSPKTVLVRDDQYGAPRLLPRPIL